MSDDVTTEAVLALRVCSCLTADEGLAAAAAALLEDRYGPIAMRSPWYEFELSGYYAAEMGAAPLRRIWWCFAELCKPEDLAVYRLSTGEVEAGFARAGCRQVNLDPGYLDYGKLVLASRKEAPDKIYMGTGVWAHTCLRFRFGKFEAPDHSFADFKDGRFDGFMVEARQFLRRTLKRHRELPLDA